MKAIQQSFSVPFNYTVHFTEDIFNRDNSLLAKILNSPIRPRVFFVLDQGVAEAHPALCDNIKTYAEAYQQDFELCADILVVPGGEAVKNTRQYVDEILNASHTYGIDRHSFIVSIGGGAVIDMVGFASAIAHRGIRNIRIPTTVLAQNDSAVGVKNSINAYQKKNFLGTFTPPYAVVNDHTFLKTLEDRDWRSGISEAVKVALIKDAEFFNWIEENAHALSRRKMRPMQELIHRCAQMHLDHIAGGDPFESGSSRPLDFGHWAAHKLEQITNYKLRHGEAVAIGICLDVAYSQLKGLISLEDLTRIINLFKKLGFQVYIPELSGETVLKGLEEFREHLGGKLTIVLIDNIGSGIEVHEMDTTLISKAIAKLEAFQEQQITI